MVTSAGRSSTICATFGARRPRSRSGGRRRRPADLPHHRDVPGDGAVSAEERVRPEEHEPDRVSRRWKGRGSLLAELPILVVIALALALVIKAFVVQAFYIPSGSMETTLAVGDRVLVNKLVYRIRDI